MSSSQAHKNAVRRYDDKAYQKTLLRLKPPVMQRLRSYVDSTSDSLNGFITRAIIAALDAAGAPEAPEQGPENE